jgi:hypothetical protein
MAEQYIGFCVKCKEKREIKDPQIVTIKGKGGTQRKAVTGVCPVCGTKIFKILGKNA